MRLGKRSRKAQGRNGRRRTKREDMVSVLFRWPAIYLVYESNVKNLSEASVLMFVQSCFCSVSKQVVSALYLNKLFLLCI